MSFSLIKLTKDEILSIPLDDNLGKEQRTEKNYARVTMGEMRGILADDSRKIALRKKVQSLFFEKIGGNYAKLDVLAQVKQNTFQKWMNGSTTIGRVNLAKFLVGLGIDIDSADELFSLQSHPLNCSGDRFDHIVAKALKDKDEIENFADSVMTYCPELMRYFENSG